MLLLLLDTHRPRGTDTGANVAPGASGDIDLAQELPRICCGSLTAAGIFPGDPAQQQGTPINAGTGTAGHFTSQGRGPAHSAAAGRRMLEGAVEETFYPRNPLDVLAQQMVAMVAAEPLSADELYALVRRASPFADLARGSFEGVLDMLSGRYPSDEFIDLRPRITWDRISGKLEARSGARRIAVTSGGTIPDRGLYGVFLGVGGPRVGELEEEMVYESRPGETFVLGATT